MKKVYRFMSIEEFQLLAAGAELTNGVDHSGHARTSSEGLCFLPSDGYTPAQAHEFLSGIVSDDVVVEFSAPEGALSEGIGIYTDPCGYYDDTIEVAEYSTPRYSRDTLRPLRYGVIGRGGGPVDWYDWH